MPVVRHLDAVMKDVEAFDEYRVRAQQELERILTAAHGEAVAEALQAQQHESMATNRAHMRRVLQEMLAFPPHHIRHSALLDAFWEDGSYETSVFVMSKFVDGADAVKDAELERVLDAVTDAIAAAGYKPRIAQAKSYHEWVWDNVELHLLGCRQGVAVVEDRYRAELNPNVAMEWGWMRGMGKPVLYLVENAFRHARADFQGLVERRFSWDDPAIAIGPAIEEWLAGLTGREEYA
jgi:hypothetical protein